MATSALRQQNGTRAVTGVVWTMVAASLPPFLIGTIAIQIGRSFSFTPAQLGLSVAAYYIVSAALSPIGGHLVALLGPQNSLRLAAAGSSVGLAAVALASSAEAVIIALAFLGLPNCLVQPSSNHVLSTIDQPRRGLAFGLVQSAIPLATLTSGLLLAVFGNAASWRPAIWIVVALTLVAQLVIPAGPRRPARATRPGEGPAPAQIQAGGSLLMIGLVLGAFLASFAATTLPSFVAVTGEELALSPTTIAAAQITGSLACISVRIVVAWRGGRRDGPGALSLVAWLLALGSVGYLLIAWGVAWTYVAGVVLAYALGWGWNGLFNLSVTYARPDRIAAATGMTQGGVFFGGVCGPLVFAAIAGEGPFGPSWTVIAGAALLAAATLWLAQRHWTRTEGETTR
ncbi:MFS transporter [Aeromicrobium sp. YIM 150415]|uniref:MFS transporter n=1 Tax=Aeromicrobium sp. YIM 150415 TaxID=2803912 RepID=UPI001963ECEA|nr:MFS transporter [Aeromicrobium sp. YIM 150415]MBM9464195.1 MFS transporter [Aeromicrobium sp. YIM 150415]